MLQRLLQISKYLHTRDTNTNCRRQGFLNAKDGTNELLSILSGSYDNLDEETA